MKYLFEYTCLKCGSPRSVGSASVCRACYITNAKARRIGSIIIHEPVNLGILPQFRRALPVSVWAEVLETDLNHAPAVLMEEPKQNPPIIPKARKITFQPALIQPEPEITPLQQSQTWDAPIRCKESNFNEFFEDIVMEPANFDELLSELEMELDEMEAL